MRTCACVSDTHARDVEISEFTVRVRIRRCLKIELLLPTSFAPKSGDAGRARTLAGAEVADALVLAVALVDAVRTVPSVGAR